MENIIRAWNTPMPWLLHRILWMEMTFHMMK